MDVLFRGGGGGGVRYSEETHRKQVAANITQLPGVTTVGWDLTSNSFRRIGLWTTAVARTPDISARCRCAVGAGRSVAEEAPHGIPQRQH